MIFVPLTNKRLAVFGVVLAGGLLAGCARWRGIGPPTLEDVATSAGNKAGYTVIKPCIDGLVAVGVRARGHRPLETKQLWAFTGTVEYFDAQPGPTCGKTGETTWLYFSDIRSLDRAIAEYGSWLRDQDLDGELVLVYLSNKPAQLL